MKDKRASSHHTGTGEPTAGDLMTPGAMNGTRLWTPGNNRAPNAPGGCGHFITHKVAEKLQRPAPGIAPLHDKGRRAPSITSSDHPAYALPIAYCRGEAARHILRHILLH